MLVNRISKTSPVAIHFSAYERNKIQLRTLFDTELSRAEAVVPDNVALITWNSREKKGILEEQCDRLGIKIIVLGQDFTGKWRNGNKAVMLSNYANSCNKPYIVALDAFDVMLQGDLSRCITLLLKLSCEAVFCATITRRGIVAEMLDFQEKQYKRPFRYLNSGMMVAKTEFVKTLPTERFVDQGIDEIVWNTLHYEMWPKIKLDSGCEVFSMMGSYVYSDVAQSNKLTVEIPAASAKPDNTDSPTGYRELLKLSDAELSLHGWKRNAQGGLTRIASRVSLPQQTGTGAVSFIRGMLGKDASPALTQARLSVCAVCKENDSNGEQLYRQVDGKTYCGVPRTLGNIDKMYRDETKDGCGCDLTLKAAKLNADCPLKRWPAPESIKDKLAAAPAGKKSCCGGDTVRRTQLKRER